MKESWFSFLKKGLSRKIAEDGIAKQKGYSDLKTNLKYLTPFLRKHWRKGILGASLILLASLLTFPQPLITRYIIDKVILARRLSLLAGAVLLLGGVILLGKLLDLLQGFYFNRFEQEMTLDIQKRLLDHTLRLPKDFFDAHQTGYLMSRISSDVGGMHWFFSSTIVYVLSDMIRFLGGAAMLIYLEWRLAAGALMLLPLLVLGVRFFSEKNRILSHRSMEQKARVSSHFQEALSSLPLIKAFSSESRTVRRVGSELKSALHIELEQSAISSAANLAATLVPNIARAVVLALGAYLIVKGRWTVGSLLAFQAYLGYVFGPAQFLASANLQLQNARASLERVSSLFDIVPEENSRAGLRIKRLKGGLEFRNVSFSYNGHGPVLSDISFAVRPGEHVAIVGPSGVGKTTLLSLILRFYKPTSGEIYFDGRPASDYEVGSLRRRIGYVSQSPLLLSGTIMENLLYGNQEANKEEVIRATKAAEIHEFIEGLQDGYQTEIGEKGVKLSEGQKQRLSLARALIKDPDILVLDEPTSALDSRTERSLFQSLPPVVQDKTLLVVTHRLSTMNEASRIFYLNENRLEAVGTHHPLSESNASAQQVVVH